MFLKLYKYNFKCTIYKLLPFLITLPILGLVIRFLNEPLMGSDVQIYNIFIVLLNVFFILLMFGLIIYSAIITIIYYAKSLFKDQGYLMHTLPVTKHQLILSNLLNYFTIIVLSYLVILVSVCCAYAGETVIKTIYEGFIYLFDAVIESGEVINVTILCTELFFLSIISSISSVLLIFLGIALGHIHSKNKNIMSVIYCISLAYGSSIFQSTFNLTTMINLASQTKLYLLYMMLEYLIIASVSYFLLTFVMKKKLNLE